ncbi:MAG: Rieske (2Fe-2S) protein [Fuerstiella sp.]|nr:Rieske (2Fe-2S) protein [Fuerstiella sp.]
MSDFQTVAKVGDIPPGQGRCFPVHGTMIGVFNENNQYFAINDFCPHMGASLSDGHVDDGAVMCPWHAWRFRLSDGVWLDNMKSEIRTSTYDVRVEDGDIQVNVPPPDDTGNTDNAASVPSPESS